MNVQQYIDILQTRFKTGISTEHTYRGDLQALLTELLPGILVTNEPTRIKCGAPDYILTRKDIPIGYIEAKDIGVDLKHKSLKEQFDRYKASLSNLIFTDYMDFHFYREGQLVTTVAIAELKDGHIVALPANFPTFMQLMQDFVKVIAQTIKSPTKLAEMMAGKAKLLAGVIERAVKSDEDSQENSQLKDQYLAFQQVLVHDITYKGFADMYAQTIAYGLFAARYHDPTLGDFSREEAARLIPHSNPFLRKLFQSIAGYDLDTRIVWLVDDLVQIFLATDVATIMRNFGRSTKQEDPVIHFYETFLANYDASLRKARGVWYTPEPVVNFIVRAVDDILKTEFGLPMGLADTSKTKIKVRQVTKATADKRSKTTEELVEQEVHKVQILDPATGTGTFLAEVIRHIYKNFESMKGMWPQYVEKDLIPRLNGFELLMTSYAMAHLQLDILLSETGYTNPNNRRFKVFLTNSLEEAVDSEFNLFTQWLSQEANEANAIKRDAPVMVVIGNPPYSGESQNKGEWIMNLMEDYKKEPGGKVKLNEKNIKWLNDDYCKFLRYAQYFIDKNERGVVAYINPHGFLDSPTFRGMRWNLMNSFDQIYILDLHGNSRKKEVSPDGSPDENVFDIIQGVSINLFVKTGNKAAGQLAKVNHFDCYGIREYKYGFLMQNGLHSIPWNTLSGEYPDFYFVSKDYSLKWEYECGFLLSSLIPINGVGICSKRDSIAFQDTEQDIRKVIDDFLHLSEAEIKSKYNVKSESRDQQVSLAKRNVVELGQSPSFFRKSFYRPFDEKWTYYTDRVRGFLAYPVYQVLKHFILGDNLGLCLVKAGRNAENQNYFITDKIITKDAISSLDSINVFPLYIYPETNGQLSMESAITRSPNLNKNLLMQIASGLNLQFTPEKESIHHGGQAPNTFAPIDLLDYIYAVLHSPAYREKYKEFLKIDFPRIPYPKDAAKFWELVKLGGEIRALHPMESPLLSKLITGYPEEGDNVVTKPQYKDGHVYINDSQYFSNVPQVAWEFYIGGYQPCQKWLKDRKGRELSFEDILHYQRIVVALVETDRLMKEIDLVGVE